MYLSASQCFPNDEPFSARSKGIWYFEDFHRVLYLPYERICPKEKVVLWLDSYVIGLFSFIIKDNSKRRGK